MERLGDQDQDITKDVVREAIKKLFCFREGVNGKKTFSFGHCPNEGGGGGGGLPMPEFFGPLFKSAFLVNKKSLFLQKCQYIELLTVLQVAYIQYIIWFIQYFQF